ncbi:MAG: hypothetical protein KDA99_16235, partial [Planctomycetales bacterium]|nr:hypothetical protein [Planctomycetales bacterium]
TMYWSDVLPLGAPGPAGFIFGDRLSGGSRTTLVSNLNAPGAVAYDSPNKSIYWTDTTATLWQPDSIYVWAGEGASGKRILSDITISQIGGIAIDEVHQQIYFTYVNPLIDSLFPGAVARADLDGSNVQTIVSGLSQPQGIAIDPVGGEVFWADTRGAPDAGLGLIQAAALDGSGRRTVVGGLDYPVGVALDILSKDVYWTDMGTGKLQRTSMSGALPFLEDVRTNLPNPRSLVNVPEPTVAISMVLAACYVLAQRRK